MKLTFTRWSRLNGGGGPARPVTLGAARALARESRNNYGSYEISAGQMDYVCPLDASRPYDLADHHRIEVHHHPWEAVTVLMVDKAFLEHLTEPDDETRCRWVTRDKE